MDMDASTFSAWVAYMKATRGWSDKDCTERLGCGINQVARWRRTGAPHYIGLACASLALDIPAWTAQDTMNARTEKDAHGTQAV